MPKQKICTNIRASLYSKYARASASEGIYVPPSGLGKQRLSENSSAPTVHFGTGTRDRKSKVADTPSPVAYNAATPMMGDVKVVSGSIYRRSAPAAKFGTGSRNRKPAGFSSAGPSYVPPSSLGKQSLSGMRSNANTIISTGVRFPPVKSKDTPGPGQYGSPTTAIGKQAVSTMTSPPTVQFGLGRAELDKKEKGAGRDTPGPSFIPPAGLGKQALSSKRTQSRTVIGTGRRFEKPKSSETPGPADYAPAAAMGKQVVSIRKTANSFSFGSR